MDSSHSIQVALGPELPEFGSWNWLGADLAKALSNEFAVTVFQNDVSDAEVVVFIKFLPPEEALRKIAQRSAIVYCPVDVYGAAAEIDADARRLLLCRRVVVHCHKLAHYLASYCPTTYIDHHVKYVIPTRDERVSDGPLLWVGVRSNLDPFVKWINDRELPGELVVLTNVERGSDLHTPERLGFRPGTNVVIKRWSPESHLEWLTVCRAAIDIKGQDFRSKHKPPAKALDFIASGVPLAMNPNSSSTEHLRQLGFELASPDDINHWLSADYAERTIRFGRAVNEMLSLSSMCVRWKWLLREVVNANGVGGDS